MCPYRNILLRDVDTPLNCNLSNVYVIIKWASTYNHGLGYISLPLKGC